MKANAHIVRVQPQSGGRNQSDFICAAKLDALLDL